MLARDLDTVTHVPLRAETQSESRAEVIAAPKQVPGALLVFSAEQPTFAHVELAPNVPQRWGREDVGGIQLDDAHVSGEHLEVRFVDGEFELENRSRHGTYLDGERFDGRRRAKPGAVLRLGRTLLLLVSDLTPYRGTVDRDEAAIGQQPKRAFVIGPRYRDVLDRLASARARGRHVVILGESGTGKEYAAFHYWRAAAKCGPYLAFNAAEARQDLAEADLFGVLKGSATQVQGRSGFLTQADGGVLFLDEVAELELAVQPKLLRAVESGEVKPVGASASHQVSVQYVCASHQSMPQLVADGRFRRDLYFRLAQEEVRLPTLAERREEVPWLMALEVEARGLRLHASAVERVLVRRRWDGNLRQLRTLVERAATEALRADSDVLRGQHFDGVEVEMPEVTPRAVSPTPIPVAAPVQASVLPTRRKPTKEEMVDALARHGGNISRAAKELEQHRTQFKRDMEKFGLVVTDPAEGE